MEGVWNEVLQADSRGSKPRVTLPGFPIHVSETERTLWMFSVEKTFRRGFPPNKLT